MTSIKIISTLAVLFFSTSSYAATVQYDVFAKENSVVGGTGLNTGLTFTAGESITGSVNPNDIWSADPTRYTSRGPYWSNADGLVRDFFATGSDESGEAAGALIGSRFSSNFNHNGLSAPYGSLVGEINNNFFLLGTSFDLPAPESGELSLFYWDSVAADNADFVTVSITTNDNSVSAVPVPAAFWLFGSALAGMVGMRKKAKA